MNSQFGDRLLDSLQAGVVLLDRQARIVFWNAWMVRHSGLKPAEVSGQSIDTLFPETIGSRLDTCVSQALKSRLSGMLTPGLNPALLPLYQKSTDRKLDQRMQQLIYITPIQHEQCACMLQIQDMTATVRRERRLRVQSSQLIAATYRDPLTGVGNRRRFDHDLSDLFSEARKKQTPLALIMIDIDHFKAYNDHFGHEKGDECLIMVANSLQDCLRQHGDRVSRYGGEEFAILLPGTDRKSAFAIAERLRIRIAGLRLRHPALRTDGHISISLGVTAIIPEAGQPDHIMITQADLALYVAKDDGRNRCMCYDLASNDVRACG
jgi:diguanylate cyclase (GGDEF)-like protein